jgi:hypothetical protein
MVREISQAWAESAPPDRSRDERPAIMRA